jgi:hypothetical protein
MKVAKGFLKDTVTQQTDLLTLTGSHKYSNVQAITTASTGCAITIDASVATPGISFFRNLDATNYVQLGIVVGTTFNSFGRLYPNQVAIVNIDGTLYAKANTGTVNLQVDVLER